MTATGVPREPTAPPLAVMATIGPAAPRIARAAPREAELELESQARSDRGGWWFVIRPNRVLSGSKVPPPIS